MRLLLLLALVGTFACDNPPLVDCSSSNPWALGGCGGPAVLDGLAVVHADTGDRLTFGAASVRLERADGSTASFALEDVGAFQPTFCGYLGKRPPEHARRSISAPERGSGAIVRVTSKAGFRFLPGVTAEAELEPYPFNNMSSVDGDVQVTTELSADSSFVDLRPTFSPIQKSRGVALKVTVSWVLEDDFGNQFPETQVLDLSADCPDGSCLEACGSPPLACL